jgi:hypothetical protein
MGDSAYQQPMTCRSMSAASDETTTERPNLSALFREPLFRQPMFRELMFRELTFQEPMSRSKRAQL